MNPILLRLIIIVTIVVAVTDLVFYYHVKKNPNHLTLPYVLMLIAITIIPIVINIWFHFRNI